MSRLRHVELEAELCKEENVAHRYDDLYVMICYAMICYIAFCHMFFPFFSSFFPTFLTPYLTLHPIPYCTLYLPPCLHQALTLYLSLLTSHLLYIHVMLCHMVFNFPFLPPFLTPFPTLSHSPSNITPPLLLLPPPYRAAFLHLETSSNAELSNLRSILLEASKRLEAYEKMEELENEIDDDLFSKVTNKGMKSNDIEMMKDEVARQMDITSNKNSENHFYEIIKRIPSRTLEEKVRKRKLLVLFQTLNREFSVLKGELENSRKEIEFLKIDLQRVHQPKQYLIAKLRDEEDARKQSTVLRMVRCVML